MNLDASGFLGSREALTALDTIGHFVGLLTPDGILLEANATALRAGGTTRDRVVGRPFWEAPWWSHSEAAQSELRAAIDAARLGETVRYRADVLAGDDGRALITIDFQLTPVHDVDGAVRFLVPEGAPLSAPASTASTQQSWAALVAELTAARSQTDALRRLASTLSASRTLDEVANAVVDSLSAAVGAEFANLAIAEPDDDVLRLYQPNDMDRDVADRWLTVPLDESTPLGTAVITAEVVLAGDPAAFRQRFPSGADDADRMGFQSLAAYPVLVDDDTVRAAIGLGWSRPSDEVAVEDIAPAVALCGAALQRAWIADRSVRLAALLETLLREAPVGFAFIDSDLRFSHVNQRLADTNGRSVADHLGRTVSEVVPQLADQLLPVLRRVFDDGESFSSVEVSGETPAEPGVTRVWEEGFYPVHTPDGAVCGAGVVAVEVTKQHEEQQRLRALAQRERAIARRLQTGLLPTSIPTFENYEMSARYEAGTAGLRVGGDWYEVMEVRPDDVTVVVGDAVGHDLDAAIAMTQVRNALTGLSYSHHDPATVVERLDGYAAQTPEAFASTLFYGRLDPASGELRYTLAGHHPPLVICADGTHVWFDAAPGPPVGVASERTTSVCQLDIGDTVICYTDGLVEHHREPIDVGRRRLLDTALSTAATAPAVSVSELVDALLASVPNAERLDDIVVLAVRRTS